MMNRLWRIIFLLLPVLIITVIALELKPEKDENVYKLLTPILYAIAGIICIGFFALVVYGMYMLGTKGSSLDMEIATRKNGEKMFSWRDWVIPRWSVAAFGWIAIHVMLYYLFPDIWKEYGELAGESFFWMTQLAIVSVVALLCIWGYIGIVAKIFAVGIAILWFVFLSSQIEDEEKDQASSKPTVYEMCAWKRRKYCFNSHINITKKSLTVKSGSIVGKNNDRWPGGSDTRCYSKTNGEDYICNGNWITENRIYVVDPYTVLCVNPGRLPCAGHYIDEGGKKRRVVFRKKAS